MAWLNHMDLQNICVKIFWHIYIVFKFNNLLHGHLCQSWSFKTPKIGELKFQIVPCWSLVINFSKFIDTFWSVITVTPKHQGTIKVQQFQSSQTVNKQLNRLRSKATLKKRSCISARNTFMRKQPHGDYKTFTLTHRMPLLDDNVRGNMQKLFPPNLTNFFLSTFLTAHNTVKPQKPNHLKNTLNTALKHFKRKAMTEYPNHFGPEED